MNARSEADIVLLDDVVAVFRSGLDVHLYVVSVPVLNVLLIRSPKLGRGKQSVTLHWRRRRQVQFEIRASRATRRRPIVKSTYSFDRGNFEMATRTEA